MPRNIRIETYSWCFTLNNYNNDEESGIKERCSNLCTYAVIGREIGSNGTPHLQGYLRSREKRSLCGVKQDILTIRCHIEKARGAAGINRRYCSKGGDYWETGVCPGTTGSKSRDELAREYVARMASGREGMERFAEDNPGTWYFSGHNLSRNYLSLQSAKPRPTIDVEWFYGPPGAGKSRKAHEQLPNAYIKEPRTKWWNGYQLEDTCIIDDFGPNGIDINHLLRWFDRYKCYVEIKGGMCPLLVCKFIVTSNYHPEDVYKILKYKYQSDEVYEPHVQLPALMRRIKIIDFN